MPDQNSDKFVSIDSVKVEGNMFEFAGAADSIQMLYVMSDGFKRPELFIAGDGTVDMSIDSSGVATIKGTPLNDKYQEYLDKRASLAKEMQEEGKNEDSLYNELKKYIFDFSKENVSNVVGKYVFLDRGRSFDQSQLEEILPSLSNEFAGNPKFKKIEDRLNALKATAVGQNFVDLKGKTPDGKDISLSDYAGKDKYVLVDFWASWCPPCRKEMPAVVDLYNKYKNKGFEIVGVSLDKTNEDWIKGIKELNITWPQISDLKYWQSDLSSAYAVNSIPHMVLIDKNGKIIARGFDAHELSDKLAELLK